MNCQRAGMCYRAAAMKQRFILAIVLLTLGAAWPDVVSGSQTPQKPRTAKEQAVDFCRLQSSARLKYTTTVEWDDLAKEEKAGTFMIAGVRTAKGPSDNVDQIYNCRVQIVNGKPQMRMIQLFKESTQSGRDVFLLSPEK